MSRSRRHDPHVAKEPVLMGLNRPTTKADRFVDRRVPVELRIALLPVECLPVVPHHVWVGVEQGELNAVGLAPRAQSPARRHDHHGERRYPYTAMGLGRHSRTLAQATESHFEVSGGSRLSADGKPLNHARLVESSAPPLLRALDSREGSPVRVRQRGSPQRSGISCIHGMREAPTVTGNPTSPRLVRDPRGAT